MSDMAGTSETEATTNDDESATDQFEDSSPPTSSLSRGRLAAIGGGAAAIGLVLGLLIGWFAFDSGGNGGDRHSDRGRMSQQQRPGRDRQDGGQMRGGPMGPGQQSGPMMPGNGGQQMLPGQENQVVPPMPSAPTTPSTQGTVVPQSFQQG